MPQNLTFRTIGEYRQAVVLTAGTTLVKAAPGRIGKLFVQTAGASASWVFYNAAATTATSTANAVMTWAFGHAAVAVGLTTTLDISCSNGIVVTVPPSGVATLTYV